MKRFLIGRKTRPIWLYNEKELFCSDFIPNYIGGRVDRFSVVCYNNDAATKKKGGKNANKRFFEKDDQTLNHNILRKLLEISQGQKRLYR